MAYDANVLRRATDQLEQRRRQRKEENERKRLEAYRRQPRLAQLDRQIQATMARLVAAALRQGGDPGQAVREVRDGNLELQQERAVLLGAMGLPADALDDRPACGLCGDTGWQGAKMCRCLKQLCAQEQIRELSKLLNLGEQSFDTFRIDYYSQSIYPGQGISPRENMEQNFNICWNYATKFGAGAGQDLPVRLHRPGRIGKRLFGGL